MTEVKEDNRTLKVGDKTYRVEEMTEKSQNIYNNLVVIEQMIKKNQAVLTEITLVVEGLLFKQNDLLTLIQTEEPLLNKDDDDSKEKEADKKETLQIANMIEALTPDSQDAVIKIIERLLAAERTSREGKTNGNAAK